MRLIFEEKLTMQQVADKIGCSVSCLHSWKAKHRPSKKSDAKQIPKSVVSQYQPKDDKSVAKKELHVTFDDFVRGYWNSGTRAVDVLLLPPEIGPDIVRYVNEALRYAYDKLR